MKVKLAISSEILEDLVTIEAQAMSEQITNLVTYIQNLDKQRSSITVKKGSRSILWNMMRLSDSTWKIGFYRWKQ